MRVPQTLVKDILGGSRGEIQPGSSNPGALHHPHHPPIIFTSLRDRDRRGLNSLKAPSKLYWSLPPRYWCLAPLHPPAAGWDPAWALLCQGSARIPSRFPCLSRFALSSSSSFCSCFSFIIFFFFHPGNPASALCLGEQAEPGGLPVPFWDFRGFAAVAGGVEAALIPFSILFSPPGVHQNQHGVVLSTTAGLFLAIQAADASQPVPI